MLSWAKVASETVADNIDSGASYALHKSAAEPVRKSCLRACGSSTTLADDLLNSYCQSFHLAEAHIAGSPVYLSGDFQCRARERSSHIRLHSIYYTNSTQSTV